MARQLPINVVSKLRASYSQRRKNLLELGFRSYVEYLRSDLWQIIRNGILNERRHCQLCPKVNRKPSAEVHHLDYSLPTLVGSRRNHLVALCSDCHHLIEFAQSGNKRTIGEANTTLFCRAMSLGRKSWAVTIRKELARHAALDACEEKRKRKLEGRNEDAIARSDPRFINSTA